MKEIFKNLPGIKQILEVKRELMMIRNQTEKHSRILQEQFILQLKILLNTATQDTWFTLKAKCILRMGKTGLFPKYSTGLAQQTGTSWKSELLTDWKTTRLSWFWRAGRGIWVGR